MRLVGVHKTYRPEPVVLRGVDMELEPGVPFVLGGANGSGKSTLLRIAAGADTPTSGSVLDRPDVVGYLPDRFPALLRLPARRYLRHLAAVHGADRESSEQLAEDVLDELGFTGEDDEPMSALSKGNAQKVGLAQALSCDAELLVLDEPWSGLDADAASALTGRLVGELAEQDVLMLVTDHTGEADRLPGAHRAALGPDGRIGAPAADPPARTTGVRVEVSCRADPRAVLDRLPPARVDELAPGRMTVRLEPRHSDAWLAAALAAGCSVRSVIRGDGVTTVRIAGAVARLVGEDVARSARFLVPLVVFAGVLAVLFGGDPGPLPVPWAASALLLYPVGAWLTHCLAETEDDVARTVTVSAAGGPAPVTIGVLMAGSAGVAVLSLLAVVWGTVASFSSATVVNLFDGLCAHLACGLTGVAVGLVCSRPLIGHLGWAVMGGATFMLVTGTRPWLPPVGSAAASLGGGRTGIGPLLDLLLAVVLVIAVTALVIRAERGWLEAWADRVYTLRRRLPGG